jgi:small subunit ribosomal protein S16
MLTIRLHRIGKINQPSFKIVVVDKRVSAAAGKFREEVGSINRVAKQIKLNKDRIIYWISKGAQPSPTVNNILIAEKIIGGKKIANHAQPKKAEGAPAAVPVASAPAK